jgi:hypothetical protein
VQPVQLIVLPEVQHMEEARQAQEGNNNFLATTN